jgi:hypothetical protein
MRPTDRCAIYAFDPSLFAPILVQPYTVCDASGITTLQGQVISLSALANTPIWDTIGEATQYAISNPSVNNPVVIAMTDGNDDIYVTTGDEETASTTYCPGADVSTGCTWATATPGGCIWNSVTTHYTNIQRLWTPAGPLTTLTWVDSYRTGLIKSPILTYTIGLVPAPQGYNSTNTSSYIPVTDPNYKYTTEYDLWHIATTTSAGTVTGEYFFVDKPSDLPDIYSLIQGKIYLPGDLTGPLGLTNTPGAHAMTCDASCVGGLPNEEMYDDGLHGDGVADDWVFGSRILTIRNHNTLIYNVPVTAVDVSGHSVTGTGYMEVDNTPPLIDNVTVNPMAVAFDGAQVNVQLLQIPAHLQEYTR